MSRHENLKYKEARKEETYVIIVLVKLASFSQNLDSFFLNGSCNAWCFKDLLLKISNVLFSIISNIFFTDSSYVS